MAKPDGARMPQHRKRPLLSLLRESGDALEAASPPFDAATAAAQLHEAARARGLLRPDGIPEDDLAVTDFRLEEEAPPFDVEAGAAQLREAARARGLLPSDSDTSRPHGYRPQDSGPRDVPFGPEISWPEGFRRPDPESRRLLESAYDAGPYSFDDFWREDDEDEEYRGLLAEDDTDYGDRPAAAFPTRTPEAEPLLTPAQVATMFRVAPKTITRWAKAGKLTSIRTLGGRRRYRETEVRALLAKTPQQWSE